MENYDPSIDRKKKQQSWEANVMKKKNVNNKCNSYRNIIKEF